MKQKDDYFVFGLKSTAGSMASMALMALPALIGIWLVVTSKDKETGERNDTKFWIGTVLIVVTALPYIPIFGLSMLSESLTN
jgi:hypothetical protein